MSKTKVTTQSQSQKILKHLSSGKSLTTAQAKRLYGVNRMSARVLDLRQAGFPIYTGVDKSGTPAYTLGQPSQEMIAMAYAVAGASLFS